MSRIQYVCPRSREALAVTDHGLERADGKSYPFLAEQAPLAHPTPNFLNLADAGEGRRASLEMYDTEAATVVYRNFLDWLFATFDVNEATFRSAMADRLRLDPGACVLVTGCGLGDDIGPILERVGPTGEVHAQDLSAAMTHAAAVRWKQEHPDEARQIWFSVGDATRLPFADNVFDAAFHFGGINLFDSIRDGLTEMNRVVRPGGRVVVSDEGLAPWLRETDYGQMVITNNRLWAHHAPLAELPPTASDVSLTWTMGNCFWLIDFTVSDALPPIDPNVIHKGRRGGSMWTRHMGQLEAVTPQTREEVTAAAASAGLSVHDWLEKVLGRALGRKD
jgi:SAM-dependent methyltransferase